MARKQPRIYTRKLKDGSVRHDVTVDFRDAATGGRKQQRRTFRTVHEAKTFLAQHYADHSRGLAVPHQRQTVAGLFHDWLDIHAVNVRATTLDEYRRTVERYVVADLGSLAVQDLTAQRLQQHYSQLLRAGHSKRLVHRVHERVRQALQYARRLQVIVYNPADDVDPPKVGRREMQCWDASQIERFLSVADQSVYGPIWRVAVATGMRRGELLGLRWQDVDWDHNILHVRQSRTQLRGRTVIQPTKSGRARKVGVWPSIMEALRLQHVRQAEIRLKKGPAYSDHGLVFSGPEGCPPDPSNLRKDFHRLCGLAGVPPIRIHDVRHTHATHLLAHGEQPRLVSDRLGHARTSMTLDVYAHALPDQHQELANRLEKWLG